MRRPTDLAVAGGEKINALVLHMKRLARARTCD